MALPAIPFLREDRQERVPARAGGGWQTLGSFPELDTGAWVLADDVDEEDRRPTQRRRLEEAQAGGFDENMEPLVSCCYLAPLQNP